MAAPEFDPATGRLRDGEPKPLPRRKRPADDLPLDAPPKLRIVNDDGVAVDVGDQPVDKDALIARLSAALEDERAKRERTEGERDDLERELRQYRAKVRRLENDKERERREYVKRAVIEQAFDHWKQVMVDCGWSSRRNCKLSRDRFDACRSALEDGYSVVTIDHASLYVARFPFMVDWKRLPNGRPEDRVDDFETVCSKGKRLEKWAQLGAGIVRREGYVFPWDREESE